MTLTELIRHYEGVIEQREAFWILCERDASQIDEATREFFLMDVEDFIKDAVHLPPGFRLMMAQCLVALLYKYELSIPKELKFELDAAPLVEAMGEDLSEWQITLRKKVLED